MKKITAYRKALEDFDLEDLDSFEEFSYNQYHPNETKIDRLHGIITSVDEYEQLSPALYEIANEFYDEILTFD